MLETKDPYILLSILNMKLRDEAPSLEELCKKYNTEITDIIKKMQAIGYIYEKKTNQFISE